MLLEKYPLRFGLNEGRISGVCPTGDDPVWVLNLKKAVLSNLQISVPHDLLGMKTVQEVINILYTLSKHEHRKSTLDI